MPAREDLGREEMPQAVVQGLKQERKEGKQRKEQERKEGKQRKEQERKEGKQRKEGLA